MKIRIHCFSTVDIEGFPALTYQTDDLDLALNCIKNLLLNHNSGISRIMIENPEFGKSECYTDINCCNPMTL